MLNSLVSYVTLDASYEQLLKPSLGKVVWGSYHPLLDDAEFTDLLSSPNAEEHKYRI